MNPIDVSAMPRYELEKALIEENKKVKQLKTQLTYADKENIRVNEEAVRLGQLVLTLRQSAREMLKVGENGKDTAL